MDAITFTGESATGSAIMRAAAAPVRLAEGVGFVKTLTVLKTLQCWQVIDSDGYRLNVGIVLSNGDGRVFWARRVGQNAWQFPQGGIRTDETPEQAMYRELFEETM